MAIIAGQVFEGGDIYSLMNLPALFIVVGGTIGAVMIQTPFSTFIHAFRLFGWVFFPPRLSFDTCREHLVNLSRVARQHGLLSLEELLEKEENPLIYKGLELLVMGVDKHTIRDVMDAEVDRLEYIDLRAANVFESMGGYSPTLGILGAVLGLIQVMRTLADPSTLGTGIAVAFVATIYGVGFANLLFIPIGNKIKSCVGKQVHYDLMIVEGITAIASGESPNMLAIKLKNYGHTSKYETTKT